MWLPVPRRVHPRGSHVKEFHDAVMDSNGGAVSLDGIFAAMVAMSLWEQPSKFPPGRPHFDAVAVNISRYPACPLTVTGC